jgi:hypothetical protein
MNMKNINFKIALSGICLLSIMAAFTKVDAAPVRFDQVVQIMNARPGQASTSNFARLSVINYYQGFVVGDDDDDKKKKDTPQQDGRVITETRTDIVEDDVCDCVEPLPGRFPKWALLGLAAIPIAFILIKRTKDTPTPTPVTLTSPTPTPTATPTVTPTPTPTPTLTPTPTPPQTVPEPVTILLFGTGLASIGLATRRRLRLSGKGPKEGDDEE